MEELLLSSEIKVGQLVTGEVIGINGKELILDIKQFAEGHMYINEYDSTLDSFNGVVSVGDKVECVVMKISENDSHSAIYLSRLPLIKQANNEKMGALCDSNEIIKVKFTKNVGRGLVGSYLGNEVFVPASQVALEEVNLDEFVGKTLEVKLLEHNERRRQYVATRRELLYLEMKAKKDAEYQELRAKKAAELASLEVGKTVSGVVSKIDNNLGAFIKFEHNQGLVHLRELSHIPFTEVSEVVSVGETVNVKVLKVDGNRIDLSLKALVKTPFEVYAEAHKVSEVVTGKIVQKLPFGAIVELADHVSGLLHVNEISWNPNDNSLASMKVGQELNVAIINIDSKKERIGLSLKVMVDNPWARVKAQRGDTVKATITSIVAGKHLVVSTLGVDGIIDIREVPMKEKSSKLEDYYSEGDEVDAVITYIDNRQWKLELSIKRFTSRIEREQFEEYMKKEQEKETAITLGDLFKEVLKK